MKRILLVSVFLLSVLDLAACGVTDSDRAPSGVGADALTHESIIHLGRPLWW